MKPDAKSICTCGHLGDGGNTLHSGPVGHGFCLLPSCSCTKFTWQSFTPSYQAQVEHEQAVKDIGRALDMSTLFKKGES